ncbi:MAG: DUF1015 domain-containing protein [Candidatus Saganbacteria bacterium]|nr:DUF1015 domain-containing protein [Candidatus Saganbacteria bacterium]
MAKIFPFRGIYYNKKKLKKLSLVMSPPYDVISLAERDRFYEQSHFNVIRLILGKEFPGDTEVNNKYLRAEKFFEGWLRHGIISQDPEPHIYIYEQKYKYGKKEYLRRGFIALLKLEDFDRGKVFPHEHTLPKPKSDRFELIRTCSANFDCVFSLYSDEKGRIEKAMRPFVGRKPFIELMDNDKIRHRVWRIDKKGAIKKITNEMGDLAVFIADGHHRYEAALKFRDEMKDKYQKFTGEESYNHIMMCFTPIQGKGLTILPIHRLIRNIPSLDTLRFEDALSQYFDMEVFGFSSRSEPKVRKKLFSKMESLGKKAHVFGMYIKGGNKYYLLTLKDEKTIDKIVSEDKPKEWRRLDVTIVHSLIIEKILGIGMEKVESEDHVSFTKNADEAIDTVLKGENQLAIFINPTKVEDVIAIASAKEKMPQKSTFFYPKLLTGLLMNKIYLDEKIKA